MDERVLEQAGLTASEVKLYYTLIQEGSLRPGELSSRSGMHRRTVYDALDRLSQKGFVSFIKTNNRRYYQAVEPGKIAEILKNRLTDFESELPALDALYTQSKEKQETLFFSGVNGIRTIFEDQLEQSKDVYVIYGSEHAETLLKYYLPHYTRERVKKKMKLHIIFQKSSRKAIPKIPLSEIRFMPASAQTHAATNIYGTNVAIILWTGQPLAILIRHKDIASSYRDYFQL